MNSKIPLEVLTNSHIVTTDNLGTTINNFGGATSQSGGTRGFVPAPSSADLNKFLKADGTWSSDVVVDQVLSTSDNTYPLLLTPTADASADQGALGTIFAAGIKANPSTSTIIATTFSGNATSANQFSSNKSVELTGDVSGSASSKAGWSITTTLSNSGVTAGSYGPSENASPAHKGAFNVPYITVDAKGRVTAASTKTITLPSDNDTNNKVTQNVSTTNSTYPLLASATANASENVTTTSIYASGVQLNPAAGEIIATKFTGNLTGDVTGNVSGSSGSCTGNAATATKVNKNLVIKLKSGSTEGTDLYTFNGSAAKTLDIKQGSNITLTAAAGSLTIASTNTTYSATANTGIELSGTAFSGITAAKDVLGVVKTSSTVTSTSGLTACPIIDGVVYYKDTNNTYSNFVKSGSGAKAGLVPAPSTTAGTTKYLREDGTWQVPPDNNTTYTFTAGTSTLSWNTEVTLATVGGLAIKAKLPANPNTNTWIAFVGATADTAGTAGYVPAPAAGDQAKFFRADGTWVVPTNTNNATAQNISTTNDTYPVLIGATANATANIGNKATYFCKDIKINPSTGVISALGFSGPLTGNVTGNVSGSSGSCTGNAATATKIHRVPSGTTYVAAVTAGNALINSTATNFGALWNAPTKNYRVGCATYPQSNDEVYICYSVTNANVTAGTNTTAETLTWNADTGALNASGGFSGNSATATKLATARYLDGVSFNGTADIVHYGACTTAAGTAAKTVALTSYALKTGGRVLVRFSNTNTAANPTLNVNSTGAKAIYAWGAAIPARYIQANTIYEFIYNGTQYEMVNPQVGAKYASSLPSSTPADLSEGGILIVG